MADVIYRKYRPASFSDLTGQDHIKTTIQNQIANGSVAHAYLFAGPRGIGKTTIARLLAKSVNCVNRKEGTSEPCGKCSHCIEFSGGRALDVIEIDAASHTGVDNIRENIIEAVRFAPGQGKNKVFIIDEVHMLSTPAFNALLKTLEEPPEHVIFVLATTELHKIPQTILSRCQRFDFHRISAPEMILRLQMIAKAEGVEVEAEVLNSIARLSEGCLRDAESLFGQILALGEKSISVKEASIVLPVTNTSVIVNIIGSLGTGDAKSAIKVLNNFVDQGGSVKNLIGELIDFARTILLLNLNGAFDNHYDADTMEKMRAMLVNFSSNRSAELLDALLDARSKSAPDAFPHLPLEIMIVEFCGASELVVASGTDDKSDPPISIGLGGEGGQRERLTEGSQTNVETQPSVGNEQPATEGGKEATSASFSIQDKANELSTPVDSTDLYPNTLAPQLSVEELQSKWKRCCEAVSKRNIALPIVLYSAKPVSIENGKLQVGFERSFHKETLAQRKNSELLEAAIEEVTQVKLTVEAVMLYAKEEEALNTLADAFGGSVV
ncbi:MAG: DNA polymerase III subunit gamma/tau [Candidatus Uhrbacteria bacterium]|nr:DNA polymerase III subunit gamma/tau [Candidatus Uhrbacteria bacterium]